ncbi:uncharacterized protein LOC133850140 isoform X2 [Drosophila sulfurigaster albostrigata]|uniref:Uncharacterized protein LOC127565259 isoform X2 n=1 Tax=Drosophila albomicans TaxID=7291 RepID=A0A9C6SS03_DROAB|nr:uncharacterized protein LOC127565259 isoform X2 [Drosophila albomicans]XP_060656130.1 uncharacterized protein LOC132791278 isoform X2 [Drosophila nasuta]XP_062142121.1 uncharacterized protein LOC133850140 isoform X2 [Drosophila sulfurigaster albostrigata]
MMSMTDVNWAAYNAFRCDLAKVHKTFCCCTQTDFTEEVGTLTDPSQGWKYVGQPAARWRSKSLPPKCREAIWNQ